MSENEKIIVEMMIQRLEEFRKLSNLLSYETYIAIVNSCDLIVPADLNGLCKSLSKAMKERTEP